MRRDESLKCTTQVLSPFVYHATQMVLADSFADPSKPLPSRMREKPGLYQARPQVHIRVPSRLLSCSRSRSASPNHPASHVQQGSVLHTNMSSYVFCAAAITCIRLCSSLRYASSSRSSQQCTAREMLSTPTDRVSPLCSF